MILKGAFHLDENIPGGARPSRLRAPGAQRREKRLARNALDLKTDPDPWGAACR